MKNAMRQGRPPTKILLKVFQRRQTASFEKSYNGQCTFFRAGYIGETCPSPPSPTFLRSKNKKWKQRGKAERTSKQKLLKGCHQG